MFSNKPTELWKRYAFAITLIVALLIGSHISFDTVLRKTAKHAETINLSGRQRMLSQKIRLRAAMIGGPERAIFAEQDLQRSVAEFEQAHAELLGELYSNDLPTDHPLQLAYFGNLHGEGSLNRVVERFIQTANKATHANEHELTSGLEELRAFDSDDLLLRLDHAVLQWEALSLDDVNRIIKIAKITFWFGIFIIVLEIMFVFYPAHKSIKQSYNGLIKKQEELEEARDEALSANRLISEFLANVSHEIRTPLNGMLGMAQVLQRSELNEIQNDYLSTIFSSGHSLLSIINNILDISKIEAGLMNLEFEPVKLARLISEVEATVRATALEKGINLYTENFLSDETVVLGDENRLRQILINLVGNAVKFTEEGEVVIKIAESNDNDLLISVSDTGPGIPKDRQEAIFDCFVQADGSTTRTHGGTGLGLAITKELVELMGGRIGVDSEPRNGATFWIALPLERAHDERGRQPGSCSHTEKAANALS